MSIKLIVVDDYESMSRRAAEVVIDQMKRKPGIVLGLATGSTPEGLYGELIKAYRRGHIDFSKVITFNLDEYIGLPPAHSQSYGRFMFEKLFEQVNIDYRNIHIPDGMVEVIDDFCEDYEQKIRDAGGIDLQVLGIGVNGHIGFNEPGSPSSSRTRKVKLTQETIKANSRFFESEDQVPRYAISMGQATIMEVRKVILLASGKNKADAIRKAVEGPITEEVPASILQSHPDATVIIDREAGSKLRKEWSSLERLFGTDGVRGVANEYPMTPKVAVAIGRAGAQVLKAKARSIVIGKDTRNSCDMLEAALIAGITSAGSDALRAGILPTPGIAYLTKRFSAATGIVISASHNPAQENGIKFFGPDGFKLPDEVEEKIEELIFARDEDFFHPTGSGIGRVHDIKDVKEEYVKFLKGTVPLINLYGMKLVLDCANGATYEVGPKLFRELGAEVVELSSKPDGGNINLDCGSLYPGSLAKAVIEKKADIGLAFDGDGDRLIPCDESGRILDGDYTMAILAKLLKGEKKLASNCVVCTQMSNLGLDLALEDMGIESVRTKVGDRYVNEEMRRRGAVLGGEESGHIIFLDCHTTGDGIITALQLLRVMRETGETLSKLAEVMHKFPQIIVNAKVRKKPDLESIPEVQRATADAKGELAGRGRVLVRYSGTQPLCRVMVEGPTQDVVARIANTIARLVEEKLG